MQSHTRSRRLSVPRRVVCKERDAYAPHLYSLYISLFRSTGTVREQSPGKSVYRWFHFHFIHSSLYYLLSLRSTRSRCLHNFLLHASSHAYSYYWSAEPYLKRVGTQMASPKPSRIYLVTQTRTHQPAVVRMASASRMDSA